VRRSHATGRTRLRAPCSHRRPLRAAAPPPQRGRTPRPKRAALSCDGNHATSASAGVCGYPCKDVPVLCGRCIRLRELTPVRRLSTCRTSEAGGWANTLHDTSHLFLDANSCAVELAAVCCGVSWCTPRPGGRPLCRAQVQTRRDGNRCATCDRSRSAPCPARGSTPAGGRSSACEFMSASKRACPMEGPRRVLAWHAHRAARGAM
jgi:hypothetical protein